MSYRDEEERKLILNPDEKDAPLPTNQRPNEISTPYQAKARLLNTITAILALIRFVLTIIDLSLNNKHKEYNPFWKARMWADWILLGGCLAVLGIFCITCCVGCFAACCGCDDSCIAVVSGIIAIIIAILGLFLIIGSFVAQVISLVIYANHHEIITNKGVIAMMIIIFCITIISMVLEAIADYYSYRHKGAQQEIIRNNTNNINNTNNYNNNYSNNNYRNYSNNNFNNNFNNNELV